MGGLSSIGIAELLISGACCVLALIVVMVILALILVLVRR
jgi:hypothetical protein